MADLAVVVVDDDDLSSKNLGGLFSEIVVVFVVEGLIHGVIVSGTLNSVSSFLVIL